jgi:hypothetical protein
MGTTFTIRNQRPKIGFWNSVFRAR